MGGSLATLAAVALLTACTTTHSIPERGPGSAAPGEGTRSDDDGGDGGDGGATGPAYSIEGREATSRTAVATWCDRSEWKTLGTM